MKKRKRLSSKQIAFFKNVFLANMPVSDALNNLNIRLTTFDRWLTKPIFLERLQLHINHFYHEARLELARTTPRAVSGLNFLSEKTLRHKEVRQACNDLLNFHTKLAKLSSSQGGLPQRAEGLKQVTNGSVLDNNGAVLAQFGAFLDNKGAAKDKLGNTNTPKNITYNPKNED